jgi:hypothetical protein
MRPSRFSIAISGLVIAAMLLPVINSANGCPFCSAPSLTLSEQVAQADAVVLVNWVSGQQPKLSAPGATEFEVAEVVQQPSGGKLVKGSKISLERYRAGKRGEQFMLFGTKVPDSMEWSSPLEVSKSAYDYIRNSPKPDLPAADRLKYFVKYLETSDKFISDDAFGEFANAKYSDVAMIAAELPRDQLRKWLTSKDVTPGRTGLYGMMLGLCGKPEDAKLMEDKILEKTDEFRLGIDGIMGGYLLLTGENGLGLIEDQKLKNKSAPFSETYAAMQAVRFMWTYGDGKISLNRLRESMRLLLDRPELADLVIADLSRMKDWSVQDKLMELYDDEANIPSVKRAIVRYMLTSTRDTGEKKTDGSPSETTPAAELPAHVIKGQKCLEELERKDPKTVTEAKRFFLLK